LEAYGHPVAFHCVLKAGGNTINIIINSEKAMGRYLPAVQILAA